MPPRRFALPPGLARSPLLPLGLSILLHLLFAALLAVAPMGSAEPPDAVPVEFFDLPRTTDFSTPEAGIVQGGVEEQAAAGAAKAPPGGAPAVAKGDGAAAAREEEARRGEREALREEALREAEAREARAKADAAAREEAAREAKAQDAEAREARARADAAAREQAARDAAAREEAERRRKAEEEAGRRRVLLPSLGSPLLAKGMPGGRGDRSPAAGSAVGTDASAREKGEIVEEGGGGFQLTSLNAPEVQYAGYFDSIRRKIELVWQYPYDAAVAGIGGELTLDFVVGRSGRLERLTLVRGSGHKVLDDEAVRAVRKAAPFNPIPESYGVPELLVRGRFIYSHGGVRRLR